MIEQYCAIKHWRREELLYLHVFPSELKVRMCLDWKNPEPIIRVWVQEDEQGRYYGWHAKEDRFYSMIFPSYIQFKICFPYGHEIEEEKGHGRMIRLSIEEIMP